MIIVASTVLGVVFFGWVAWAAWFNSDTAYDAELESFDVVSTHEVRVKMDIKVSKDHIKGSCLLRATASDHTIVGETNLSVATIVKDQGRWIPIRTERRATTVEKISCTADKHGN
ncbi:MAG: hypothetical protein JWP74_3020 [Marmoricola sp.]|nr:hypothetical protein [Marmoricola sp.]